MSLHFHNWATDDRRCRHCGISQRHFLMTASRLEQAQQREWAKAWEWILACRDRGLPPTWDVLRPAPRSAPTTRPISRARPAPLRKRLRRMSRQLAELLDALP